MMPSPTTAVGVVGCRIVVFLTTAFMLRNNLEFTFFPVAHTLFLSEYINFFRAVIFLNFPDFELGIILELFLNTKGRTSPKNSTNIFQCLLMFYYIIELSKSLYFLSIMQNYI